MRLSLLRRHVSAAGVALFLGAPALTAQVCSTGLISEITFDRNKPFGEESTSEESKLGWVFRGMNSIHATTRPGTIRWELFFREGDCYDPQLMDESERSLRSLPYIVEAEIEAEQLSDGTYRVDVRTVDAWALSLSVAFTVDNGFQITGLSANAKNLFGTGTQVGLFRNLYRERLRIGLLGRQPNLFGSRIDLSVHGGETRAGNYFSQSLFRPFAGEVGSNAFRQSAVYRDDYMAYSVDPAVGFTQAYLRFEAENYEAVYQRRFGSPEGTRFLAGIGISREVIRFPFGAEGARIVMDNEFDESVVAPEDVYTELQTQARDFAANRLSVTLGVRALDFSNFVGLDALTASQDVQSGGDLTLTVAPSIPTGDDSVKDVLLRLQGNLGIEKAPVYLRFDADLQVRHVREGSAGGRDGWRDFIYEVNGTGYWTQRPDAQLFGRVQWAAGENLDRPFQLTLGGRESVRGYNEDAYPGSRRLLLTLEERIDLPSLSTGFADVGIAVFGDAGRMEAGEVPFGEDSGWRAGIGAGLRLGIPAGAPNVLRVDVGTPLTGERGTKGIVFRVYGELLGILDRRGWPTQVERSRWYGIDPDLTTRPINPLASN